MAYIKLQKRITETADSKYRLQVWVSETSNNIPSEIFIYRYHPYYPKDLSPRCGYCKVALYADMLSYPKTEAMPGSAFFRQSWMDVVFASLKDAADAWTLIKTETVKLVNDIVDTHLESEVPQTVS